MVVLAVEIPGVDVALDVDPGLDVVSLELLDVEIDIEGVDDEDRDDVAEPALTVDPAIEVDIDNELEPGLDCPGIESGPGTYFVRS